ncbi:MAG: RluA family pseudouridine synthase [Rhodospirillaceae bacterium]|nr:RluA family pseudouridine synthase [Rhodospirillaceae bacterium]MYB13979.1 RluA family pseudouridine synthase [Rhodospirillaceae bacterium]MYI48873.1 RluA family pseudouridine synthase [Rhodospirillaceae bacterium]
MDDDLPETETIAEPDPVSRREVRADDAAAGRRLDAVLAAALDGLSRTRIQALVKQGAVKDGDGRTVGSPSLKVAAGQRFTVDVPPPVPARPAPQAIPLEIAFEDDHLIVIDKPAGLVVHPGPGSPDGTLVNALLAHCGDSLSGIGGVARPGIVHRIDKDTSGLLVAAKTDAAHAGLAAQFAEHSIERRYTALAWGEPRPLAGRIDAAIGRDPGHRTKMAVRRDGGRAARTYYTVTDRYGGLLSLIDCRLATGRTHQIRVHLAHRGHPLVGDYLYGGRRHLPQPWRETPQAAVVESFRRQALHAARLGFVHPVTGEALAFGAALPQDIAALVSALKPLRNAGQPVTGQ